ncbi:MAG: hypothetical protein KDK53_18765 [Maritimibacter sp.]|nr:hypothetical protein [Maritimibacter sp.]
MKILLIAGLLLMGAGFAAGQNQADKPAEPADANTFFQPLKWRCIGPFRGGRSVSACGVTGDQLTYYMGTTGGGLWKTEDAGQIWHNISDGFFKTGTVGAVAVSESDPNVVYCGMGEHAVRGVMTSSGDGMYKSTDGGKTFTEIATPHGDNHGLWIDPADNRRMIQGNDGGACISYNAGESFSTVYNQLTAQFYRIFVDDSFPYRVYGTQQDNSSLYVPNDTSSGVVAWSDCSIAGTGESGFIAVDPKDPDIVYVGAVGSSPGGQGSLQRADMRSGQIQLVNVWPEEFGGDIGPRDLTHRFPWTFPILFSPHDPNVLYACGEMVFRSTDNGHSWQPISPDLTRNDKSKLGPSGGDITFDTSGAEHYATIASFRESSLQAGLLWSASDDGFVYVSRDNGGAWTNVTPTDLPEWAYLQTIEPSPFDAATAYLAATRYKLDDTTPYLFKTTDYGATWTRITDGIPDHDYTRVVRCDTEVQGLLYAGTESGLYISFDDGVNWERAGGNLPVSPVFDMAVKHGDLIVATHGRSFWVLDDLSPLREIAQRGEQRLYPPRRTVRVMPDLFADWMPSEGRVYDVASSAVYIARKDDDTGLTQRTVLDAGEGAPRGVLIHYTLPADLPKDTAVKLSFLDAEGNELVSFSPKPVGYADWDENKKMMEPGPWIAVKPGLNRFVWNLRLPGAEKVPGNKTAGEANKGPIVPPGDYQVRFCIGDECETECFRVATDPRVDIADDVLKAQFDAIRSVIAKISDAHKGVNKLRTVRGQVEHWHKRLTDEAAVVAKCEDILKKLGDVEDALIQPGEQKNTYSLTNRPRLNAKLSSLLSILGTADAAPTESALALVDDYSGQIDGQLSTLERIIDEDIHELNRLILTADAPPVAI